MNLEDNPLEADDLDMEDDVLGNILPVEPISEHENERIPSQKINKVGNKLATNQLINAKGSLLKTSHVNPANQFTLTMSEYVEVSTRLEDSKKLLTMVNDALSSKENLDKLRHKVD